MERDRSIPLSRGRSVTVATVLAGAALFALISSSPCHADIPFPGSVPGEDIGSALALECGLTQFEASGSVYHPYFDALFVVSDDGKIALLDTSGTVLNCFAFDGNPDFEGLTFTDPDSPVIYAAIEDPDSILVFDPLAPCTGVEPGTANPCVTFDLTGTLQSTDVNQGLEAITFVPVPGHPEGGVFYTGLQEDGRVYIFDVPLSSGGTEPVTHLDTLTPIPGLADIASLHYERETDLLYMIFDGADRLVLSHLDATPTTCYHLPGNGQEGLARESCDLFVCDNSDFTVRRHAGFPFPSGDTDADGVNDCTDDCPGTLPGALVNATGCACEQPIPVICGDGLCDTDGGEDCYNCSADCNSKLTGNPSKQFCCGDTVGCEDPRCTENAFDCGSPSCCGDFTCGPNETACNCEFDCGTPESYETPGVDCFDGYDNDCDGLDDCLDPDCCTALDCGPDEDIDGFTSCDCNDEDGAVWSLPGISTMSWTGNDLLSWSVPIETGGLVVTYDLLRADNPSNFLDADCLQTDLLDVALLDSSTPPTGSAWFYLVRTGNNCVGEGSLGTDSAGRVRYGRRCKSDQRF
jgi:hypothetical protein